MKWDFLTIAQFCENNKICRATYYNLKDVGLGPVEFRVGRHVRISKDAETAWRRKMEGLPEQPQQ